MRCWKSKRVRMLQCLQSQTHAHTHSQWNTPLLLGAESQIALCWTLHRMQRPLSHNLCMKNTLGGSHWGLYPVVYGELTAFFFLTHQATYHAVSPITLDCHTGS